ncbi:hypothetical protein [Actinoplanes couchii]|uniref:DUF306 domain-containing protein n=1 Tax=Actinoplanes couchii TaxID=403638 RepID=A0ABQ3X8Q2_9ACTN|nr:hypothetical protein [Actinoplanes couchii]MDR6320157.1 hypothetical protein [Actinoplanes couchii]GID54829.1 hypothetical protein Aco03nite_032330 [Actinoplanes couchii]
MNAQAGHPTKPRTTPIALWVLGAVVVLIAAVVLWVGWPRTPVTLPAGDSRVDVYVIDDHEALTYPAATGEKDGWFGRLSLPCGVTMWYVESAGTAMCATLGGPHGKITVTGTDGRLELPADSQAAVARWAAENSDSDPVTRVLLTQDGDPVAIVTVATPATAVPAT